MTPNLIPLSSAFEPLIIYGRPLIAAFVIALLVKIIKNL